MIMANTLVVIPCLNEISHIKALLDSLSYLDNTDIIVADGGSTDGTQQVVKDVAKTNLNIKLLANPKKIQSAAINLAVKEYASDARYLVRLDAHGEYPDNFVLDLVNEAHERDVDSIVVSMDTIGKSVFQDAVAVAQNSKLGNGGSDHRNANLDGKWVDHGHHALMSIEAFLKVGGYDESFVANEDAELDFRLTSAGYKIWLTGRTNMKYFPRDSFYSLYVQYYRYGLGRASNVLKHKQMPKLRQMIPLSVFPCFILALFSLINLIFAIPFLGWLSICISYGALLAFQNKAFSILLSGLIAATMHMGWSIGFCRKLVVHFSNNLFGKA